MELYREYEYEVNEINRIQKEQQKLRENIQQYEHKRNENEMVKNELNFIEDSDVVYKLIGPILVKQEADEARMTVDKRLEFINKEISKAEKTLKEQDGTIEAKRKRVQQIQAKIVQLSKQMQQQQGK